MGSPRGSIHVLVRGVRTVRGIVRHACRCGQKSHYFPSFLPANQPKNPQFFTYCSGGSLGARDGTACPSLSMQLGLCARERAENGERGCTECPSPWPKEPLAYSPFFCSADLQIRKTNNPNQCTQIQICNHRKPVKVETLGGSACCLVNPPLNNKQSVARATLPIGVTVRVVVRHSHRCGQKMHHSPLLSNPYSPVFLTSRTAGPFKN